MSALCFLSGEHVPISFQTNYEWIRNFSSCFFYARHSGTEKKMKERSLSIKDLRVGAGSTTPMWYFPERVLSLQQTAELGRDTRKKTVCP